MGISLPPALPHGCGNVPRSEGRRMIAILAVLIALMLPAVATAQPPDPHAGHVMPAPPAPAANQTPTAVTPVPPVTDADRAAAFPDVHGHTVHDNMWNYRVLFDQLEWQYI